MSFTWIRKNNKNPSAQKGTDKVTDLEYHHKEERQTEEEAQAPASTILYIMAAFLVIHCYATSFSTLQKCAQGNKNITLNT